MTEIFPTENWVKRKVTSGILILVVRRVLFQLVLTTSSIFLARNLAPGIFGTYAIISFWILVFGNFVTLGLGSALIQTKKEITTARFRTVFTVIFFSSLLFILVAYPLLPLLKIVYKNAFDEKTIFWLRLFSLSVIFTNLGLIPVTLLERKLNYSILVLGEVSQLIINQSLAIFLALRGFGVGSLVLSYLIAQIFGCVFFFIFCPWPVGFNFSLEGIRKIKDLLTFGINFLLCGFIGAISKALVPGFVGAVSGPEAVGLISWAGGVRAVGLAPLEIIDRLIFPVCSRVQDQKEFLKRLIEKIIRVNCLLGFPLLTAIFVLARPILFIIYTDRWSLGLTALYLFIIQSYLLILETILIQVLMALGKIKTVRNITFFWTVMQWLLTVPLVLFWNFNGLVLARILVSATIFIPLNEVRKEVKINIWPQVLPYLGYSILTGLVMFWLSKLFVIESLFRLLAVGLVGAVFYWAILLIFKKEEMVKDFRSFRNYIFKA